MAQTENQVKSVCVIGAGPSGLVTAKTLVHNFPKNTFRVTVYEKEKDLGGLWPSSPDDASRLVNPAMKTNISRHTVSFSDLAWPEDSPYYPRAWEVGHYLKRYSEKYSGFSIHTGCEVRHVQRSPDAPVEVEAGWQVTVLDEAGKTEVHEFDHVVVASGFFTAPKPHVTSPDIKILHSSHFRSVKSLLDGVSPKAKNIVIVGGSMSGTEIAASMASQLSSLVHSPEAGPKDISEYRIYHVFPRPFWVMPLFTPTSAMIDGETEGEKKHNPASAFLPYDLNSFTLDSRPPGIITDRSGTISALAAELSYKHFKAMLGSDQAELSPTNADSPLCMGEDMSTKAPHLAISDTYTEFVRSGLIIPILGRIEQDLSQAERMLTVSGPTEETHIDDVAACILATGFDSTRRLKFFPPGILNSLDYNADYEAIPLNLDVNSTVSDSVPGLGFVGFYRGQFWGVMEMQARFLGSLWSGSAQAAQARSSWDKNTIIEKRKTIDTNRSQSPQFPMGDYTYIMEFFKDAIGIERIGEDRVGPIHPSRYIMPITSDEAKEESMLALAQVGRDINTSKRERKFVAYAIFRALQGDWKLERNLISSISTYPSGRFKGLAKFHPRDATGDEFDAEYLYIEEGDFETETGLRFRANRRYAHRYTALTDTLSIWFTKADNKSVDYLFHEFEILPPAKEGGGWRARAHHLCIKDTYDVEYEFVFRGVGVERWSMKYDVKGPQKDYRIESFYRR